MTFLQFNNPKLQQFILLFQLICLFAQFWLLLLQKSYLLNQMLCTIAVLCLVKKELKQNFTIGNHIKRNCGINKKGIFIWEKLPPIALFPAPESFHVLHTVVHSGHHSLAAGSQFLSANCHGTRLLLYCTAMIGWSNEKNGELISLAFLL